MSEDINRSSASVRAGISFGSALAIAISYSEYHSIFWAILHGICSWFFVIWFWLVK